MGDHLHRRSEILAAPFPPDHRRVDPAGGNRIAVPCGDADIALVMAEIEIGLGAVVGDVDLPMLVGAHRAGIDVEVRIELSEPDLEAARLKQRPERRRRETLAERGDHAAGDKNEPRHGTPVYSIRGARHMVNDCWRGTPLNAPGGRWAETAPPVRPGAALALPEWPATLVHPVRGSSAAPVRGCASRRGARSSS